MLLRLAIAARRTPKTFKFFKAYKSFLESRSTFKTRMKGAPFFAIYNVGDYTFAPLQGHLGGDDG
ncbi:putative uncharacterized protein [Burkholderiales bacterium GJ-E10]|nr:putative uncharacterized protein [Burkholderiales bacterium GJ-E10]